LGPAVDAMNQWTAVGVLHIDMKFSQPMAKPPV
jgi:hypothetical protein